jgi:hypothetical protein
MLEAMVQAARALIAASHPLVLGEVKALKYGNMVRPGEALEVEVILQKRHEDGSVTCKGIGGVRRAGHSAMPGTSGKGETAVSGRFTLRPMRA